MTDNAPAEPSAKKTTAKRPGAARSKAAGSKTAKAAGAPTKKSASRVKSSSSETATRKSSETSQDTAAGRVPKETAKSKSSRTGGKKASPKKSATGRQSRSKKTTVRGRSKPALEKKPEPSSPAPDLDESSESDPQLAETGKDRLESVGQSSVESGEVPPGGSGPQKHLEAIEPMADQLREPQTFRDWVSHNIDNQPSLGWEKKLLAKWVKRKRK